LNPASLSVYACRHVTAEKKEAEMGEAREVMNRVTEAITSNDQGALKGLYAEDAVIETPDQGTISGRDAIVAYFGELGAAFSDVSFESAHEHESGDTAIDEGYLVGTHTGPLEAPTGESIPATGKRVRVRAGDAATVANGVVTSHRFYFDQMEFLGQLGLAPEA
jgi:ketosteroid isomerase-like protein